MQKTVKSYSEEGTKYQFDSKKMQMYANQLKYDLQSHGKKKNKGDIMKELAEKLFVSEDAVKTWMYGTNGPSDLEQVKQIADYFGIDYHQLLDKEETEMATNSITTIAVETAGEEQLKKTKECIREIYIALIRCKNALVDLYYTVNPDDNGDPFNPKYKENQRINYSAFATWRDMALQSLEKSMLDIPAELYNRIYEYIWTDMNSILDEIMSSFEPKSEEAENDLDDFGPGDEEILDYQIRQYRNGGFTYEMRKIFEGYIVK